MPRGSTAKGVFETVAGGDGEGVGRLVRFGATAEEEEGAGSRTVGTPPTGELLDVETVSKLSAPVRVGVLGGAGVFIAPLMRDIRSSNCDISGTRCAPFCCCCCC